MVFKFSKFLSENELEILHDFKIGNERPAIMGHSFRRAAEWNCICKLHCHLAFVVMSNLYEFMGLSMGKQFLVFGAKCGR